MLIAFERIPELVTPQLNARPKGSAFRRALAGRVVDKFFAVGAICGIVGSLGYGLMMWLMLQGWIDVTPRYSEHRVVHGVIQFYLFFGLFVLGFLLQVGPRMLRLPYGPKVSQLLWIAVLIAGMLLRLGSGTESLGRILLAAPFAYLLISILSVSADISFDLRGRLFPWFVISLSGLAVSPWLELSRPVVALFAFWIAFFPTVFLSAQQFLVGFSGGVRLSPRANQGLIVAFLFVSTFLGLSSAGADPYWLRVAGGGATLMLGSYVVKTQLLKGTWARMTTALPLGFLLAFFWALAGAVLLMFTGADYADVVLHWWSIGWLTTLVLAIGSQIMRAFTGRFALSEGHVRFLLWAWQVVPISRAAGRLFHPSDLLLGTMVLVSTGVLLVWGIAVVWGSIAFFRRNLEQARAATAEA